MKSQHIFGVIILNKNILLLLSLGIILIIIRIAIGSAEKNEFSINIDISSQKIYEEQFRYYVDSDSKNEIIISHQNMNVLGINRVAQNKSGVAAFSVSVFENALKSRFYVLIVSGKDIVSYKMPDSPTFEWSNEKTLLLEFRGGKTRKIRNPF